MPRKLSPFWQILFPLLSNSSNWLSIGKASGRGETWPRRYESLRNLASLFKNQIMVDEATDSSMLQLAGRLT